MNLRNLTAPDQWTLSDNSLLRRILVCFLGEVITAVGIAICLEGKSGVDPFTAFLQGISHVSGISFAAIVPIVNIIMLILVFPFDRSIFGLGTVINFTVVGVLVDYFRPIYRSFFHVEYSGGSMLLHLAIGLPLFCLGVSMYITCDLGQCPYDGIAPSLRRHFPRYRYRAYRLVGGARLAGSRRLVRESAAFRAPSWGESRHEEAVMSKRGRKRRARAKSSANHGKRPNA